MDVLISKPFVSLQHQHQLNPAMMDKCVLQMRALHTHIMMVTSTYQDVLKFATMENLGLSAAMEDGATMKLL